MTKIKTRLFSAVIAAAISVTAAVSGSVVSVVSAGAAETEKQYTLGTKVSDKFPAFTPEYDGDVAAVRYSYTVATAGEYTLNWKSDVLNVRVAMVQDTNNTPYRKTDAVRFANVTIPGTGKGRSVGLVNIESTGKGTEVNLTAWINAGENPFYISTPDRSAAAYEFSISPATPTPFKSGTAVQWADTTGRGELSTPVIWNAVAGAKYVVYYVAFNHATGRFGDWNVKVVDTNSFTLTRGSIEELEAAHYPRETYYITILPFTDTPTRQYGGFSPYVVHAF